MTTTELDQVYEAIDSRDVSKLEQALAGLSSIDKLVHGSAAIHYAVIEKFPEGLACMIKHGADLNLADSTGRTALHYAVMVDSTGEMARSLITAHANVNAKTQIYGSTPLDYAIKLGFANVEQIVRAAGGMTKQELRIGRPTNQKNSSDHGQSR